VKFTQTSAAGGRNEMRDRQRRARASMPELRVRFPKFHTLRIEFDFNDSGPFIPAAQATVLHPPAPAYFVFPCPYSDCSGEFDLSAAISDMEMAQQDRCEGQLQCSGQRSYENRVRAPCALVLEFQVEAHHD
jgi:hypothetical protein